MLKTRLHQGVLLLALLLPLAGLSAPPAAAEQGASGVQAAPPELSRNSNEP